MGIAILVNGKFLLCKFYIKALNQTYSTNNLQNNNKGIQESPYNGISGACPPVVIHSESQNDQPTENINDDVKESDECFLYLHFKKGLAGPSAGPNFC